jgi:glutamine synthetase
MTRRKGGVVATRSDTADRKDKVEAKRAELAKQGVRYCIASFTDINGVMKAKFVPLDRFAHLFDGSELYNVCAMEGLTVGRDANDFESCTIPDLDSLVVLPWKPDTAWMAADLQFEGRPDVLCARQALKRVAAQAREMGFVLNFGIETELYVLRERADGTYGPYHPDDRTLNTPGYDVGKTLDAFDWLDTMVQYMNGLGFGVYSFDHEAGHGQFEFDFGFAEVVRMADRMTFFRLMAREVARLKGAVATFMPKPFANDYGSGGHFNMSLADAKTGANLMGDRADSRGIGISQLAYQFVAGVLEHAGAITAVAAPTVNSYKRLVARGFNPEITWAPIYRAYGDNNKTLMVRIPRARNRIENRAADGANNVYLAAALTFAAGLEGIRKKLDPGPPRNENMYLLTEDQLAERGIRYLPRTLLEAVEEFESDSLVNEVFSPELRKGFIQYKRKEWADFHNTVTPWEVERYLKMF